MCMFSVFIDPYNMRTVRGEKIIKLEMEMRTEFLSLLLMRDMLLGEDGVRMVRSKLLLKYFMVWIWEITKLYSTLASKGR